MYRNQYYITNLKLNNSPELKCTVYKEFNVYSHSSLNISRAKNGKTEILLAGYIINPFKPHDTNDDIVRKLADSCSSKEFLFRELQSLSGRYVLLYSNEIDFVALNDACAMRQLYYGFIDKDIILTSSPRMFLDFYGGDIQTSVEKQDFMNLREYEENDSEWYGDKCIDDRLRKVLPNHFLDMTRKEAFRSQIWHEDIVGEKDIVEYSAAILKGNMDAITKRYQIIQPLTAGWDSRTLLAASKEYLKDIRFYVVDFSSSDNLLPDVWVSRRISDRLGLNLQVIRLKGPSEEFLAHLKKEYILPRYMYAAETEYFYNNYSNSNTVRVNGIAGATIKAIYGYTRFNIDTKHIHHFTYYFGKSNFIKNEISQWADDARAYAQEYEIPILDLLHWEQKVGNWAASCVYEQDIAIENFSPHANRNLFVSILRIRPQRRAKPECLLISKIIRNLWEDALCEPVNPVGFTKKIRRKLHRSSLIKNYQLRILSMFGN